jgi:hypothetical protein
MLLVASAHQETMHLKVRFQKQAPALTIYLVRLLTDWDRKHPTSNVTRCNRGDKLILRFGHAVDDSKNTDGLSVHDANPQLWNNKIKASVRITEWTTVSARAFFNSNQQKPFWQGLF